MLEKIMNFIATLIILCAITGFIWSTVNYYSIQSLQTEITLIKDRLDKLEK